MAEPGPDYPPSSGSSSETGDAPRWASANPAASVPRSILGFVLASSGWHQVALFLLAAAVFILIALPIDLQRRIVNAAVIGGDYHLVLLLAIGYGGVALVKGGIKLFLNIYRAWVSERAILQLREWFYELVAETPKYQTLADAEGVEISVLLSEAEPVGSVVGIALSEPILQGGLLVALFGYMLYLQPWLALMSFVIFATQVLFVPLMQGAINRAASQRIQVLRDVSVAIVADQHGSGEPVVQHGRIHRVFDINMRIYRIKFWMNFLMNITNHLGVAFVLALGGWFAVMGEVEIGTVVAFVSGITKVNEPWGEIVNWYRDMAVAHVKYRLIVDVVGSFESRTQAAALPAA